MIHIDWMIGSDKIDVDGIDKNGKQVWGSENGPFIFDKKDK